ncbi:MAG: hypothetical protein RRA51_02540 [Armatimonadota bacterium]|nr:hypothetical protein [Armatimonadota bacterium]
MRFWVEDFRLAFTIREFGKGEGDHNFVGDINWAIRSLRSVMDAFVEIAVMGRALAPTFDKPLKET